MGRVVVVALHISKRSDYAEYKAHNAKSAEAQIQYLVERIKAICEKLKVSDADAEHWVVAWREYGVSHAGSKFLSKEQKKLFKQAMCDLTKEYPKLTLVAGSVASKRDLDPDDTKKDAATKKMDVIQAGYVKNQWILTAENNLAERYGEYQSHQDSVERQLCESQLLDQKIIAVRNTCYIFSGGQCVARHDKTAPWKEVNGMELAVFQSDNSKGNSAYISPLLGVEICRESVFSVLKHDCVTASPSFARPLLHFLLSDSVTANLDRAYATFFVHLDSMQEPKLVVMDAAVWNANVSEQIRFYQDNLLVEQCNLFARQPVAAPGVLKEEGAKSVLSDMHGEVVPPMPLPQQVLPPSSPQVIESATDHSIIQNLSILSLKQSSLFINYGRDEINKIDLIPVEKDLPLLLWGRQFSNNNIPNNCNSIPSSSFFFKPVKYIRFVDRPDESISSTLPKLHR